MSDLRKKILKSLKWKKNANYCANKLNIPVEKYLDEKRKVLFDIKNKNVKGLVEENYDLESGKAKLTGKSLTEPKSAEEIIALLKIDTTQWKLSQYWNKQMSDHWRISALVTKIKNPIFAVENLKDWKPKVYNIPDFNLKQNLNNINVCGVISLQDIHFGKKGNETIDIDFENTLVDLLLRGTASHNIEVMYFVVGGDLINMDTWTGQTTNGTPVENGSHPTKAYVQAFDAMHWAINLLTHYCKKLVVVYVPGNHDRLTSYHLVHALSKSIKSDRIDWDIEYAERKVHVWGDNFNAFEHGDTLSKNTPLIYATEFAKEWGKTKNRTLYTGHFHQNKKTEYVTTSETTGFIHKILPSLSHSDYYHYHKKYTCNRRSGKLELQSYNLGNICELTYSIPQSDPYKLL